MIESYIIYKLDGKGVFPVDSFPDKSGAPYSVSKDLFFDYTLGKCTLRELLRISERLADNLDMEKIA